MTNGDPAQPMIEWVTNMPPADLAAELLGAFGPGGSKNTYGDFVTSGDLVDWLFRGYPKPATSVKSQLLRPITEAMQLLEHAELVYVFLMWDFTVTHSGNAGWTATRLGWALLAKGKDAVRQRIKDRTGL
jgi:hypothetical protein